MNVDDEDEAQEIPELPEWIELEAIRRREEMKANPSIGLIHEEVWKRIEGRRGQR